MKTITLTPEQSQQGYLMLVNEQYPLEQTVTLDTLKYFETSDILLERRTALVLENLFKTLNCGNSLLPVSGFRTLEEQKQIYASSLAQNGADFTHKYVALPNCSEHQTGLAIDLALNQKPIDFIRPHFPAEGICGHFRTKMTSYGFIERYPEGKEALTGISPEPWHFRYVGIPHASIMERHGFCLEEYLDYLTHFPWDGKHLETQILNKSFEIFYKKAEDRPTQVELPGYLPCQVSGTNTGGFIFTLWR